jgi:hypothetical protein
MRISPSVFVLLQRAILSVIPRLVRGISNVQYSRSRNKSGMTMKEALHASRKRLPQKTQSVHCNVVLRRFKLPPY